MRCINAKSISTWMILKELSRRLTDPDTLKPRQQLLNLKTRNRGTGVCSCDHYKDSLSIIIFFCFTLVTLIQHFSIICLLCTYAQVPQFMMTYIVRNSNKQLLLLFLLANATRRTRSFEHVNRCSIASLKNSRLGRRMINGVWSCDHHKDNPLNYYFFLFYPGHLYNIFVLSQCRAQVYHGTTLGAEEVDWAVNKENVEIKNELQE
jgi:hypothetical protein